MRIPYVDNPPTGLKPEEDAIVERIKARRGPKGLVNLDLTLLHSPQLADGWGAFFGAVRNKTSLSVDLREIAMCRTAGILGASQEWDGHRKILAASEDFQVDGENKMKAVERASTTKGRVALSEVQWAVLRYADAMTRNTQVPDEVFEGLKKVGLNNQQIVELTLTVAAYNCVGKLFVALDIGERNATTSSPPLA